MGVLDQVSSLLRSEIYCLLWKVLFVGLRRFVHRHVLTWTQCSAYWLFTEAADGGPEVLWVFVEDRVLAEGGGVEWLKVVSWTWRNVSFFLFIHHFKISWALSLSSKRLFKAY